MQYATKVGSSIASRFSISVRGSLVQNNSHDTSPRTVYPWYFVKMSGKSDDGNAEQKQFVNNDREKFFKNGECACQLSP